MSDNMSDNTSTARIWGTDLPRCYWIWDAKWIGAVDAGELALGGIPTGASP